MFRNHYVHPELLKPWSDDGSHVSVYNPITKEKPETRKIDSLYYFDYPKFDSATAEEVRRLEDYLSMTLSALGAGNLNIIKDATEAARSSLLFQHTRLPLFNKIDYIKYGNGEESLRELKSLKGIKYYSSNYVDLCADFLRRVTNFALFDSIALMDLDAIFLASPEGRGFITGPSAFNAMNPYFEKRFIKCRYVDKAYDLKGAILVLPLEPGKALMLYDPSIYLISRRGSTVVLTAEDIDILNMIQIYNSDIDGVVYKGEPEELDRLLEKMGTLCSRDGYEWMRGDRFPFSSLLSFMSVRDDAQKNIKKNVASPLRPFVGAMREYDSARDGLWNREMLYNRYLYAQSLLREM